LGLILVFLSVKIIQTRRSYKISSGDGNNKFLQSKIRAHGNFIEYAPIFLIMLLLCEIAGLNQYLIHCFGIFFVWPNFARLRN